MEHVVFFPAQDGTPAFRRFAGLEDAVRFVEHLRNVENVGGASVHSLTEVPLAFKAWYRVELPGIADETAEAGADESAAATPQAPAAAEGFGPTASQPTTIAETIETYTRAQPISVDLPEVGSATGVIVPDQPLVAVDQFSAPPPIVAAPPDQPDARQQPDVEQQPAQVLEPVFGARRDRGIGFFAR